jgi:parvulin-like peptidyl-prolyl isomerase
LLLAVVLSGCGLNKPKATKPVVGPPPPRVSFTNDSPSEPVLNANLDERPIQPAGNSYVSTTLQPAGRNEFSDIEAVAYVNGDPILASEVLEPYAGKLEEVRPQVPPQQFRTLQYQLIERDLQTHIENKLLIQAFRSTLSKEQEDVLENAMSTMFDEQISKLKDQFAVNTDYELELKLQGENSSLAMLERSFANRVMASEYMRSKQGTPPTPARVELLEYYHQIKDKEYAHPARVRWEQIEVSYGENGGKAGALEVLKQAASDLRNGVDFAEVAKKYSNGPGATQGGYWDWMPSGSLANQEIEQALFSMPIGRISDVFVGESSYQIVRVLERELAHHDPFEEVQEALKEKLAEKYTAQATEKVMQELKDKATIATVFDRARKIPDDSVSTSGGSLFNRPFAPPPSQDPSRSNGESRQSPYSGGSALALPFD